ncbi:breast cancer anti-estrogen resistance protein 1-like isoform X1 [Mytilus californianus]|uniref:breast cancer anti-estrogen resistance protein 1-like isoform X1 n=2 Tax=Mytilus californianus TaxID=6549 RepID=UPI0022461C88|nr:breast cancer anti-estrogen resistance protein 1-like isoform X1 [Mytilus californianus]
MKDRCRSHSPNQHLQQGESVNMQTILAKAVYDNKAETPDELAFRRGDVLSVIEQDTGGLEGWWLCSYRGKQGIAPGNRLQLLTGMQDSDYQSPMTQKQLNRRSWDVTPNKVGTPTKTENQQFIFETPEMPTQDYDVPPTRPQPIEGQENYDTPPKLNSQSSFEQLDYDTPPQQKNFQHNQENNQMTPQNLFPTEFYDVPTSLSNRSSIMSNLSHLSHLSNESFSSSSASNKSSGRCQGSNQESMTDSARSSMDISPHDFYDVPPSRLQALPFNHHKQPSADSGLDMYDSPQKQKSVTDSMEDYDVPKADYDIPKSHSDSFLSPGKHTENAYDIADQSSVIEHDIDDIYDVPKSNTLVRKNEKNFLSDELDGKSRRREKSGDRTLTRGERCGGVYDIPPQVTRDSMFSSKSDSSESTDEGYRLSICSLDSRNSDIPIYDELPYDLDAAMDLMVKLQQDVQKATTKLCSFISSSWRRKDELEPNLYNIKSACTKVKATLEEFLEFAQGTLANSAKLPEKKLINKLTKQLCPLLQNLEQIKSCLKNLELISWQLSSLVSNDASIDDDLGKIALISKDLTSDVKKMVSLIHGNSTLLFKRAQDSNHSISTPPKPPVAQKPTVLPKPSITNVQGRPLPLPPRPLPPTPTDKKSMSFDSKTASVEFKRDSGDLRRLSEEFKQMSLDSYTAQDKVKDENEIIEEYDYVHLDSPDGSDVSKTKIDKSNLEQQNLHPDLDDKPVKETSPMRELTPPKIGSRSVSPMREDSPSKQFMKKSNSMDDILSNKSSPEPLFVKTPVDRNFKLTSPTSLPSTIKLDPNDKQVVCYYSSQLDTHSTLLTNAVDAFFSCIECGQGPKVFISNSKFVVVSAHKLVYIGDTLHRNLMNIEVRNKIMHCANHLCDILKLTVSATKTAALQYPSIPAVQEMVDKVVDVSHAAYELKLVIGQASAL